MDKQLMIQEMLNKEFDDFAKRFLSLCEEDGECGFHVLQSLASLSQSIHKEADPLKRSMLLAYYTELVGAMLEDSLEGYEDFSAEVRESARATTKATNEIIKG